MQPMKTTIRNRLLVAATLTKPRDWKRLEDTVLVIQPDHLGDIVLSQPAVNRIRERHPTSRLVAIIGSWSREIATIAWPVDDIVSVEFPGFTRRATTSAIDPYRVLFREAQRLRSLHAHTAYVLRPDGWWSAWLASMSTPEVVTSDESIVRRFATSSTHVFDAEHAAIRSWRIASIDDAEIFPSPVTHPLNIPRMDTASTTARDLLESRDVARDYIVIHPGSGAAVKEWPLNRWIAVGQALVSDGFRLVVTGGPSEVAQCSAIADAIPSAISLAGSTNVSVLAEVLRGATLVLGPDCGPLHLAVAVGTPTIHLFGPSDHQRYGPWGDTNRHRTIHAGWNCPRCGDLSVARAAGCGCMLAIQTHDVVQSARDMLLRHHAA